MIYGLTADPSGLSPLNDRDTPLGETRRKKRKGRRYCHYTARNRRAMSEALQSLGDGLRLVLEIGVSRKANPNSSTGTILKNLRNDTVYLGVDTSPRRFNSADGRVRTLKHDSSDTERVLSAVEELRGERVIDFLHIDGWHSVNQVVRDWRYAEFVRPGGVVMFHDTNFHPGPVALLPLIDRSLFDVQQYFKDRKDDWGVAVARKRLAES